MIGLMFLVAIGLWITLAIYLGRAIPKWMGLNAKRVWTVAFTSLIIVLPITDEIIGRYQFKKLCEQFAKVESVIPNQSYETLSLFEMTEINLTEMAKPTEVSVTLFADTEGNKPVRSEVSVKQSDQWILRWLGLGANSYCDGESIKELTAKEKVIRTNRYMEQNKKNFVIQYIKSSPQQLNAVLEKFNISKK